MDEEIGDKMGMVYQVYFQTERRKTEELVREAVEGGVQCVDFCLDPSEYPSESRLDGCLGEGMADLTPGHCCSPSTPTSLVIVKRPKKSKAHGATHRPENT